MSKVVDRKRGWVRAQVGSVVLLLIWTVGCGEAPASEAPVPTEAVAQETSPRLHHVHLNSVDPEAAVEWYQAFWPSIRPVTIAGSVGFEAEMFVLFDEVDSPPPGGWDSSLHRPAAQSPFWHFGLFTNTTDRFENLAASGIDVLPLFIGPDGRETVMRSGLVPYQGMQTEERLGSVEPAAARFGGFGYVVGPDGALIELTGGPNTTDSFTHVHFFHENPRCAANWYVEHLGFTLPPVRDRETGETREREPWDPCEGEFAEPTWPSLEPIGTIRGPNASVRYDGGSISFYPRQCHGDRCGAPEPLHRSRGQVLDHVAFTVHGLDAMVERLREAGVTILEEPYPFENTHAVMIEDLDGLAIELIEAEGAPVPRGSAQSN